MAEGFSSTLKKIDELVRTNASEQAAAYRKYGEALAQFGSGKMGASDLVVSAGNLYVGEIGRLGTAYVKTNLALSAWALEKVGIRFLPPTERAANKQAGASPTGARARTTATARGRQARGGTAAKKAANVSQTSGDTTAPAGRRRNAQNG